ncbi:MAG: hypothetical protein AB8G16_00095 [Gammaproteobacteria bacterium]
MDNACEHAKQLQLAFRLGLIGTDQLIRWADSMILSQDTPAIEIIDLALMRDAHPQTIVGKLGELAGAVDEWSVMPEVMRRYALALREKPELGPKVAKGMLRLYDESNCHVPKEFGFFAWFDEEFYLAREGIYGAEEHDVYEQLLAEFDKFADPA